MTVTVTKIFYGDGTVTAMRIFVPGDGDGEKKHDYTVFHRSRLRVTISP